MRRRESRLYGAIRNGMQISAVQKLTLLDFPGKTACIAFTPGCNFRCGFCHNPEFVLPEELTRLKDSFISPETFFSFLEERRGRLDGVVITGGEPTIQRGLADVLRRIKSLGFQTKLDTNGSLPEMLEPILNEGLADYVAMDVKTSLERYAELASACVRPEAIKESMRLIKNLAPDYEFRTTILAEHHDTRTLLDMRSLLFGAKRFALQGFRPGKTLNPDFERHVAVPRSRLEPIKELFGNDCEHILIRA